MSDERVWHNVGTRRDVESRKLRRARVGVRWVALHVWNGRVWAIGDECPHRGATLGNGIVDDDGFVECPEHGWQYHVETGRGREDWEGCVARFDVREENGQVLVAETRTESARM
jgi:nitrite reductase/ring-hydroxylating ferredoxin subunit